MPVALALWFGAAIAPAQIPAPPSPRSSAEAALHRRAAEAFEKSHPPIDDPALAAFAARIAGRFAIPEVSVQLYRSRMLEAAGLPPGMLYLSTGVLTRTESEAEFAGVVAHLLGHLRSSLLTRLRWTSPCSRLRASNHPRRAEPEAIADSLAAEYLVRAGYDPLPMLEFFNKLLHDRPERAGATEVQDLLALRAKLEEQPPARGLSVNTTEFLRLRERITPEAERVPSLRRRAPGP